MGRSESPLATLLRKGYSYVGTQWCDHRTDSDRLAQSGRSPLRLAGEDLTYVAHDPNGELLLAHSLSDAEGISRYLVSSIDAQILSDLKAGRIDVYSALRQPRCWIADLKADVAKRCWHIQTLYRVDFDSIPKGCLPQQGAMLTPELDPHIL